jgi:LPS-assembly lipoprotein
MKRPSATMLGRRSALLAGAGLALSGCGFHPVYSSASATDPGPAAGLAAIEVQPIYERPGQILREALKGRLRTEPGTPRHFDLNVSFWIAGDAEGILNFTQATRIRLIASANWTLVSRDGKHTQLTSGSDRVLDGFDIFDTQYFAVDLDNEHVQRRMAEAMAEQIALRLAMWFHQHPSAMA